VTVVSGFGGVFIWSWVTICGVGDSIILTCTNAMLRRSIGTIDTIMSRNGAKFSSNVASPVLVLANRMVYSLARSLAL